jgi:hypothetical protein
MSRIWGALIVVVAIAALVVVAILLIDDDDVDIGRGKTVTIYNMVTSGPTALRQDKLPLRLFTSPAICYDSERCATDKPQFLAEATK